jgi:O-antigen/teichoic acid export membrane protein
VLLSNPVIMAVSNILGPRVAHARVTGGHGAVAAITWNAARLLLIVTSCFCGLLILFRQQVITLLFGAEFARDTSVLIVMSFSALAWGLSAAMGIGLTALERPQINTRANVIGLVVTALTALLVSQSFGALGGAIALLLGSLTLVAIQTAAFLKLTRLDRK